MLSGESHASKLATLCADYTIRMNFTTVPRTWELVNIWTHRIPVHYKVSSAIKLRPARSVAFCGIRHVLSA